MFLDNGVFVGIFGERAGIWGVELHVAKISRLPLIGT
jgi:hypothetical protein